MQEPKKIRLTDSPETKKVKLTPLPSLENKYLEGMKDDVYSKNQEKTLDNNLDEDNSQNDS